MTQGYRGFQSSITLLLDCTDSVLSVAANGVLQQQLPQNATLVSTEFWENFQEIQYVKCVLSVSTGSFAFIWTAEIASDSFVICTTRLVGLERKKIRKSVDLRWQGGGLLSDNMTPYHPSPRWKFLNTAFWATGPLNWFLRLRIILKPPVKA